MIAELEPLLRSPGLLDYFDELARVIAYENQRRERFYNELTEDGKFEFINGQVFMHSPAKAKHIRIAGNLYKLLDTYVQVRRLGLVSNEKALCVFPRNDYEPDIVFFGPAKARRIEPDTLKHPIPDFIVEVLSPSTEKNDRGVKFVDYAMHGTREYWIIDTDRHTVEKHVAENKIFRKARPQKTGAIASAVIAGFEIPVRAIFEEKANLAALRRILAQ